MLASVYSYRVMVKSISCCVRGRRVLSNPSHMMLNTLIEDTALVDLVDMATVSDVGLAWCTV